MRAFARRSPDRVDRWRFVPADRSQLWRARRDVTGLIWIGGAALTVAARLFPGRHQSFERLWSRAVTRRLRLDIRWRASTHRPSERYLIAPLHESFADVIPLLQLPVPVRFLARDELFGQGVLGPYLRAAAHIKVPRPADVASLRRLHSEVRRALAEGDSVVVFPKARSWA